MYQRILVAIDGTECSEPAITHAIALGQALHAELTFLYAVHLAPVGIEGVAYSDVMESLRTFGETALEAARAQAAKAQVTASVRVVEGRPAHVIEREAEAFDLVVMGSHGRGGVGRAFLGSVTTAVLHHTTRPVLVVRSSAKSG